MTQHTGTKLVLGLLGVALALGITSWWYRYEAAHRASQFWGPEAARLIAESEGLEAAEWGPVTLPSGYVLEDGVLIDSTDLSKVRGQAHLRHALMSDRNYVWDAKHDPEVTVWRWRFRFHEGQREAWVVLSKDFDLVGKFRSEEGVVAALSCKPMMSSLEQYFHELGLISKQGEAASTPED